MRGQLAVVCTAGAHLASNLSNVPGTTKSGVLDMGLPVMVGLVPHSYVDLLLLQTLKQKDILQHFLDLIEPMGPLHCSSPGHTCHPVSPWYVHSDTYL